MAEFPNICTIRPVNLPKQFENESIRLCVPLLVERRSH